MTNPNKAKGTDAENRVVSFLRQNGFPQAERRAQAGSRDRGDIAGVIGAVLEVKSCKRFDLGEWLKELLAEMDNDNARVGALWIKRRMTTDPGEWFVLMDGYSFVELLREWAA